MQDNKPNASKLIDALRQVGYDNYTAIADLIDNSLDAYANRVMVDIGEQGGSDYLLVIADNGQGMSKETLTEAIRLGSVSEKNDRSDLGKYGMGIITASISIGRKLVVVTKHKDKYFTAIHDVEAIKRHNEFVATVRDANDLEKNQFIQRLGGAQSGTILFISEIDNLQNKNVSAFKVALVGKLGEIFREFLNAGKKIYVGSKEVLASDPLMLDSGSTVLIDEEKAFGEDTVRLRIAALPRLAQAESKARGFNIPNQGFYLMRNNRQIARAESLGVYVKHNQYNRFRAEIFFPATLDKIMGVTFTKNGVSIKSLDEVLKNWLDHLVQPQILAIKRQSSKDKTEEAESEIDHASSERAVKIKSKLLPDALPAGTDDTNWRKNHSAQAVYKVKKMGRLGPIFEYDNVGRKIVVTYNSEHPFYQNVFAEIYENKELTNAMDFLSYSIAAGLTKISSEDTSEYIDTFLDTFSDSLRTLLN